jgi:hypothetical protein
VKLSHKRRPACYSSLIEISFVLTEDMVTARYLKFVTGKFKVAGDDIYRAITHR